MEPAPSKRRTRHPAALRSGSTIFSANSVALATDPRTNWGKLVRAVITLVVLAGIAAGVWLYTTRDSRAELAPMHVTEKAFNYSVKFFRGAVVQDKNGRQYIIHTDENGKQTAMWVLEHDTALTCADDPKFSYTPANVRTEVVNACYRSDGIIYVSNIIVDKQVYQLNLTSQRPVARQDAQAIFGSLQIE
jgi:hypothetical protein